VEVHNYQFIVSENSSVNGKWKLVPIVAESIAIGALVVALAGSLGFIKGFALMVTVMGAVFGTVAYFYAKKKFQQKNKQEHRGLM